MTRNHFHFGAAGFYTRMAARKGCIAIALSSRGAPQPNVPLAAGQAGPLSVAVPTLGDAPDLMLDGGLKTAGPWDAEAAEADPKGYLSSQAKTCGHPAACCSTTCGRVTPQRMLRSKLLDTDWLVLLLTLVAGSVAGSGCKPSCT